VKARVFGERHGWQSPCFDTGIGKSERQGTRMTRVPSANALGVRVGALAKVAFFFVRAQLDCAAGLAHWLRGEQQSS
jgi:hypothetical protein